MPMFSFVCDCGQQLELNTKPHIEHLCPSCSGHLRRLPNLRARTFIHERDKAQNTGSNSRYRDWFTSPEVQEKIRNRELVPVGKGTNPLTEHLDAIELEPDGSISSEDS